MVTNKYKTYFYLGTDDIIYRVHAEWKVKIISHKPSNSKKMWKLIKLRAKNYDPNNYKWEKYE